MILLHASYFSKYVALLESVVESLSLSELFVFKKLYIFFKLVNNYFFEPVLSKISPLESFWDFFLSNSSEMN